MLKRPLNRLDIVCPTFKAELNLADCPELLDATAKLRGTEYRIWPIDRSSSLNARKATELIAVYFRREFEYDFIQYEAMEPVDPREQVFLITTKNWEFFNDGHSAVGAVVFRWREYTDAPHQLVLAWIWIHPFLRRQGILSTYWPVFKKLYGDFHVEAPLSEAMIQFLKKQKHSKNMSDPTATVGGRSEALTPTV